MNPYAWNRISLGLVYGRSPLVNELLSSLPASQSLSFAVAGGRRMGKTTVLRAVEAELHASEPIWEDQDVRIVPVYIDGLSLPRPLSAEYVWGELARQISDGVTRHGLQRGELSFDDFVSVIRKLLSATSKAVRIVVLFDEIEPVLLHEWADGFFANWRALLSNVPEVSPAFAAVFTGARELVRLRQDVGSPLMDILEFRSLRNLSRDDCKALVDKPTGGKWSDEFQEFVYTQTGGQPMLVQYVMHVVCGKRLGSDAIDLARGAVQQFLEKRAWQFSDLWYKSCTVVSQRVYRRLPADGSAVALSILSREFGARECSEALEILQHVGIVTFDPEALIARRTGLMFSAWQELHGPPIGSPQHDAQIYRLLEQLDPALATKYASAWGILGTTQPNYSGAVSEIRDTVTLVLKKIAPDEMVMASAGYKPEAAQEGPTRKQRARFAVARKHKTSLAKALADDIGLFDAYADQFSTFVASSYGFASGLTHTTSTFELAYQALKQADSILAQILA